MELHINFLYICASFLQKRFQTPCNKVLYLIKDSIIFKTCSGFIAIMSYDTVVSVCDVNTLFSRQYFLFNKHNLVQLIAAIYYALTLNQRVGFFL